MLGYFSDNELPAPKDMLDRFLALDAANPDLAPNRAEAQRWLDARKGHAPFVRSTLWAVPANGACPPFSPHGFSPATSMVDGLRRTQRTPATRRAGKRR